ncbi:MAG: hypothetical protein M3M94_01505 [Actinomycetota bacterium]|nr:hypothetical protein [Actinomycetota bacterium]
MASRSREALTAGGAEEHDADSFVELSNDELAFLIEFLELDPVSDLPELPSIDTDPGHRRLCVGTALRALAARGIVVSTNDGEPRVVPEVEATVATAAEPLLVLELERRAGDVVERGLYGIGDDLAVEVEDVSGGGYRLWPQDPDTVHERLLELIGIRDGEDGEDVRYAGEPVVVPVVPDALQAETTPSLADAPEAARSFVEAIAAGRPRSRVVCLTREGDDRLVGGELTWVEDVDGRLWLFEPTSRNDANAAVEGESVTVRVVSPGWIVDELGSYVSGSPDDD